MMQNSMDPSRQQQQAHSPYQCKQFIFGFESFEVVSPKEGNVIYHCRLIFLFLPAGYLRVTCGYPSRQQQQAHSPYQCKQFIFCFESFEVVSLYEDNVLYQCRLIFLFLPAGYLRVNYREPNNTARTES